MKFQSKLLPASIAAITLAMGAMVAAHAEDQLVKIGHTGPLSGPNAYAAKRNENGVRMALDELNTKKLVVGGKTLKFELVSEDDQCDPKAGMAVAQKMTDAGVKFIMGPYCSGVAIPASKVYDEGGAILATLGSNPKVTMGGYKSVFRIVAGDNVIGTTMAQYAFTNLKAKTAGVIDDRTAFGQGLVAEFIKEAKVLGLKIVGQEYTTDKATDFNAILTTMKGKAPDVLFYGGYAGQAGPMVKQLKGLGIKAPLLGGDAMCTSETGKLAGDAANDSVFCAHGGAILDKVAGGPKFKAEYKKRFNQDPDVYAATFYDQTMFVASAMQKVGTTDSAAVSAELHKGSYKGVMTTYAYDEKGNLKKAPITIYTFKAGAPTPVQ